jgi:HAD superfamily hydrolase (TIGR01490 family)
MIDPDPPPRPFLPRLVVFDLDGTITRRDTLAGYVFGFAWRHPLRLLRYLGVVPMLLRFALGRADHGALKGALIRSVMGDASREDVGAWTARWVPILLRKGVFRDAVAAIEHHRAAGEHLVLMTATVDLYVPTLAAALGFDEHLCSHVGWDGDRLDGRLVSANLRGEEKARQLRLLAARFPGRRIMGYGNSRPDLPHLRLVDQAVLVNPPPRLRAAASDLPVEFKYWL